MRQLGYKVIGIGIPRRLLYFHLIVFTVNISVFDILRNIDGVLAEILEDNAKHTVKILDIILPQILAVQQYLTLRGVIKPCEQLYKGGLTRSVESHKHSGLPGTEREVDVLENISVSTRIRKAYIHKLNGVCLTVSHPLGYLGGGNDRGRHLHKGDKVVHKKSSLIYAGGHGNKRRHGACDRCQRARIQ